MSRLLITHIFIILYQSHCFKRITDHPYDYIHDDRDSDYPDFGQDDDYKHSRHVDDNDDFDLAIENTADDDIITTDEVDEDNLQPFTTRPIKTWLSSSRNNASKSEVHTTDVISRLRELEKLNKITSTKYVNSDWDENYEPTGHWPAISIKMPKITRLSFTSPSKRSTRSFRDLFQTLKYKYNQRYKSLSNKYPSKSDVKFTSRNIPRGTIVRKHTFHSTSYRLPLFTVIRTQIRPSPEFFPKIRKYSFFRRITSRSTKKNSSLKIVNQLSWLSSVSLDENLTMKIDMLPPNEHYENALSLSYDKPNDDTILFTTPFNFYFRRELDPPRYSTLAPDSQHSTRTYPYKNWICYECGKNETKFGSSLCHDVFETDNKIENAKKHSMHYRCNGNSSVKYQCYKRFLDIGHYNELGCRNWPPRRSGNTYASKRLRVLEELLKDVADGCVFSPHAALVPLSRTIQLYARFHVCVCHGTLCNIAVRIKPSAVAVVMIVSSVLVYQ